MDERERRALTRDLARLGDGDRTAFEPVFAAALPLALRLAEKMLAHRQDAEDAAQEALLKVFARAQEFDPNRDACAWILGITAFECRTLRKRRTRRREELTPYSAEPDAADVADPETALIAGELREALARVLGTLSASDLETITASFERERRGQLGTSAATFRKRLQRAFQRLRQAWRETHGHG